ncbi:MAG: c-type cytochrome [Myxococcaceae bacterium]|nr:c-type cytochrome [Myxococcaceae bacterium]MBH2006075.1 c-type cytochrome [Myxococcaceae bacterium]
MADETERDQERDHDYDGIREYNNPLPRWWLLSFFSTVVFTFAYWGYYHVLNLGMFPDQALVHQNQMTAELKAAAAGHVDNAQLISMSQDPDIVAAGKIVFFQACVACHGDRGQGGIGPNLTDRYWMHGSSPMEIRHIISHGVVEKGMTAWKSVLSEQKINELVAFILTLKNTAIPGKAPQGVLDHEKP